MFFPVFKYFHEQGNEGYMPSAIGNSDPRADLIDN